ncbi:response regulator [Ferruginibacter yonginensis]|uniref:Response regulator n=1 Tax=Ferruginibacter yonginensis TaxID=1310416 RepID=A0ABV8QNW2_9BACT
MSTVSNEMLSVFLADDDADDRLLFEEALMEVNNEVKLTTANNGELLLQSLDENTPPKPHLIFLDLNMPVKNGMECLEDLKKDDNYKDVPVVIFSTSCQQEAMDQVYKKGANYYMCKPDNFQKLKQLLKHILNFTSEDLLVRPTRENFYIAS